MLGWGGEWREVWGSAGGGEGRGMAGVEGGRGTGVWGSVLGDMGKYGGRCGER